MESIKVSIEQANVVDKSIRSQYKSKLWFQQRSGCITASKLNVSVHTNWAQPSQSLIMFICYLTS